MKLPTGNTRSDSIAKKMSSGTSPGTATVRQPVRGSRIAFSPSTSGTPGCDSFRQVDPVEERRDHAASEQLDLPREQQVPHRMVVGGERLPILRDDITSQATSSPLRGED